MFLHHTSFQLLILPSECDLFHNLNNLCKISLIFFSLLRLFLWAQENKFWIFLPGTPFHLNKSFYSRKFIHANNLITCAHVKAFLHNICCYKHIYSTIFEILQSFS